MINVFEALRKEAAPQIIMQVHDELVFDVQKDEVEIVKGTCTYMNTVIDISIPIEVEVNTGLQTGSTLIICIIKKRDCLD